ncbi:MAG TPA: hypothetical protein VFR47_10110 [Anaerolineales bacterium]|nr:hypothetical protein [Anaerolineales bacterium]
MLTNNHRKTFGSWYLSNLLGWAVGILVGFDLESFYLFPWAVTHLRLSPVADYLLGVVLQLLFPLLALIVCVGLAQWLRFRQWKIEFDRYEWIAANIKGTFVALVILFIIGLIVGEYQRPILDFLYGDQTYTAQTPFILSFISVMLPLLGSIGTSVMVAKDILNREFGKSSVTKEE